MDALQAGTISKTETVRVGYEVTAQYGPASQGNRSKRYLYCGLECSWKSSDPIDPSPPGDVLMVALILILILMVPSYPRIVWLRCLSVHAYRGPMSTEWSVGSQQATKAWRTDGEKSCGRWRGLGRGVQSFGMPIEDEPSHTILILQPTRRIRSLFPSMAKTDLSLNHAATPTTRQLL